MDAGTLKTLGQIAGIGGLAIGAFIWLFRDLLQKANLPKLTSKHLTLILSFSFTLGVIGIVAWLWIQTRFPVSVEAECGVAAGQSIKVGEITVLSGPCDQKKTQKARDRSNVSTTGGVAAGENIEGDKLRLQTNGR